MENNNEDQTLIKPEQIKRTKTLVEEDNLRDRIRKTQEKNKKVVKVVEKLKKAGMKILSNKEQTIEEGVVMKEGQIYVLEGELRGEVIWLYYNILVEGYKRKQKIIELVTRNYWQPEVMKEVEKYVDGYNACQYYKNCSNLA